MMQKPAGPIFDIIGARLHGPEPIEDVFVPWRGGVSALYGLNGAGKSRILHALRDLYTGVPGHRSRLGRSNSVFVRIAGGLDQSIDHQADGIGWTLAFPFTEHLGAVRNRIVWPWHPGYREDGGTPGQPSGPEPQVLRDAIYQWLVAHEPTMGISPAVASEILDQGIFTLTPAPSPSLHGQGHTWHIGFAVLRDPAQPLITDAIDRFLNGWADILDRAGVSKHDPESFTAEEVYSAWAEASAERDVLGDTFLRRAIADGPTYHPDADLHTGLIGETAALLESSSLIPFDVCASDNWEGSPTSTARLVEVIDLDRESDIEIDVRTRHYVLDSVSSAQTPLWRRPESDGPSPDGGVTSTMLTTSSSGGLSLSDELLTMHNILSELASKVYDTVMLDSPELGYYPTGPDQWFLSGGPSWSALDLDGSERMLSELSEAQQRWAKVAIRLALHLADATAATPTLLVLDEPDAALHSTAERHAVAGLSDLAASFGRTGELAVLVATHSREFLNASDVWLMHAFRTADGSAALRELENPMRERLDLMGLSPADAFQLYRVVLVVEGHHEQVILSALLGQELDEARTLVVPMRGGRHLATVVDAEILADFSDAPVLVMLDNLDSERIGRFWSCLQDARADEIDALVRACFTGKQSSEEQFVISFARRVVASGQPDRFHVHAMSKPDIPEYLPVEYLVPEAASWEELREQFNAQTKIGSFKPWLKSRHGVEYTDETLTRACQELDHLPADFTQLLNKCHELAGNALQRRSAHC